MTSSTTQAIAEKTGWLHGVLPGKTHDDCKQSLGTGALVFLGGMVLTGASFLAEQAIIRAFRKL
jgi:hypothetical protein